MVLCGSDWVNEVFKQINPKITIDWFFSDGDTITKNQVILEIRGSAQSILSGERATLNFLQILSAVATKTQYYVKKIVHTKTKVLDTRKKPFLGFA